MLIQIIFNILNFKRDFVFLSTLLFLFYLLFIISPISIYNNASNMITVGIKNHYSPFLLALFIQLKCNNFVKINQFLKIIVFFGFFSSALCIFEIINIVFDLIPPLKSASHYYASLYKSGSMVSALDLDKTISFLRPTGLFFDYTQNGFYNASCFFILFLCGNVLVKNKVINRLMLGILYAGVIFSTSRQSIISFHFLLLIILFIKSSKFNINSASYLKKSKSFLIAIIILILPIALFYISDLLLSKFIFNEFSINIVARSTPTSIIISDLMNIFQSVSSLAYNNPFYFIFGFGFYIGGELGVSQLAPPIVYNYINSELHYFYDTLTKYGLIGFLIYWSILSSMAIICWKAYNSKFTITNYNSNISLLGFILFLFIGMQLIHYSPYGVGTNYIIAIAISIASISSHKRVYFKS